MFLVETTRDYCAIVPYSKYLTINQVSMFFDVLVVQNRHGNLKHLETNWCHVNPREKDANVNGGPQPICWIEYQHISTHQPVFAFDDVL